MKNFILFYSNDLTKKFKVFAENRKKLHDYRLTGVKSKNQNIRWNTHKNCLVEFPDNLIVRSF